MSEWPDTTPPQKGVASEAFVAGRYQYCKTEVSPGRWQWVVNEAAMLHLREMETKRRELYLALRSRVLTDEEMAEVGRLGDRINIENGVPYDSVEKARELNDALLQQFKLRAAMLATPADTSAPSTESSLS